MNRRDFLRRASLVASGAIAADQFELLDRLGWVPRLFGSIAIPDAPSGRALLVANGDLSREGTMLAYAEITNAELHRLEVALYRGVMAEVGARTPFKIKGLRSANSSIL